MLTVNGKCIEGMGERSRRIRAALAGAAPPQRRYRFQNPHFRNWPRLKEVASGPSETRSHRTSLQLSHGRLSSG